MMAKQGIFLSKPSFRTSLKSNWSENALIQGDDPNNDYRACLVGPPLPHGGEFRDLVVVGYSCRPVVLEARVDGANDGVPARLG